MRRVSISLAVLALVLAGSLLHAAEGPALYRIERKNADDLAVLRSAGIPIVQETSFSLFVLGGPDDLDALANRGYDAKLLDAEPATADYLMVGVRPNSNVDAIRSAGTVLFAEENWLLLRIPAGMDDEVVHDAHAWVARVPEQPVAVPKPAPAFESQNAVLSPNPIVQKVLATVTDASIQAYWNAIVGNQATRFSTTQGCRDAATYCLNTYTGLKLQAQNHVWSASNAPNVIGTHTGATHPGDIYIFVAHLDDLPSGPTAPGADDNGSGSAAVLEAAKALSCWGVRNTVKFLNATGEEQGLFGSDAYAANALAQGDNILGVINHDMIGWTGDNSPPSGENLDLNYNAPSQWLAQRFVNAAANYGTGLAVDAFLCPSLTVSDHAPFWQRGFSAVCGITDNEGYCGHNGHYPHYHVATDTIANNGNPAFYYKVVKTTVATLAELADPFKVTFGAGTYACGAGAQVLVADRDLNTSAVTVQSVAVHVWSASEPAGETLMLSERGTNSMIFDGTIPTTAGPTVSDDGLLSISAGETLHVEYVDALDCDGAAGVTYAATASINSAPPCGPHAAYGSQGNIGDVCAGGPGDGNGTWDPGESVQFKVGIANDGIGPLTGISGTMTSSTQGVVMTDGTASFPNVAAGASVDSSAPHFTLTLPQGLACGSQVAFNLTITSEQGSWSSSFTHGIGTVNPGGGNALDEHFASGIPATWTVVNGGTGGGAAATWTTANPGSRTFASPLVSPVAIVDSGVAGAGQIQDEQLITPVMNLATATSVTLQFDQYFNWFESSNNERGDVDIRSSSTAGAWVNLFRNQGADSPNPEHRTLNITAQAAGAADVQVRFHYYLAAFEWWWQVDNVNVTYTSPSSCTMNVCLAPPPAPPPVPDGTSGAAMTATRAAADGSSIDVGWDASSCTATGYKVLYGPLSGVSSHVIGGSVCVLGTSGTATWSSVPAGDLWYVVVATDGAGTEGSWGNASAGPMGGTTPSAQCGDSARNNSGTCP